MLLKSDTRNVCIAEEAKIMGQETQSHKTNPDLIEQLERAAKGSLSPAEIASQRVSFVYSIVREKSGVTRAQVQKLISRMNGSVIEAVR